MNPNVLAEALKLSPSDRLQLIEALWDTLSEEAIPIKRRRQHGSSD
jgi:putative addiction module component (TIGR02574 family)